MQQSLTLMDILPQSTEGPWLTVPGKPDLEELVVTSRTRDLDELAMEVRERHTHVDVLVTTGSPFVELIRQVVLHGYDLVIKTAQGREGRVGGLLGTTALHLMRKCPVPVWVVKPRTSESLGQVLAAVDPKPEDPDHDPLTIKVLELAGAMAQSTHSALKVVHAWWLSSEAMLRGRPPK